MKIRLCPGFGLGEEVHARGGHYYPTGMRLKLTREAKWDGASHHQEHQRPDGDGTPPWAMGPAQNESTALRMDSLGYS